MCARRTHARVCVWTFEQSSENHHSRASAVNMSEWESRRTTAWLDRFSFSSPDFSPPRAGRQSRPGTQRRQPPNRAGRTSSWCSSTTCAGMRCGWPAIRSSTRRTWTGSRAKGRASPTRSPRRRSALPAGRPFSRASTRTPTASSTTPLGQATTCLCFRWTFSAPATAPASSASGTWAMTTALARDSITGSPCRDRGKRSTPR